MCPVWVSKLKSQCGRVEGEHNTDTLQQQSSVSKSLKLHNTTK